MEISKLRNKTNSTLLLLHKKSKSFNSLQNCSTPKVILDKELESINLLNESGQLDSPKVTSPIIRSSLVQIAEKNSNKETPKIDNVSSILANGEVSLETLSRKIKFEDEPCSSEPRKFSKKLETVQEDEELLAHVTEIENNSNLTEPNLLSGFQTANGKALMYNKEKLIQEKEETLSGFLEKSLLYKNENIIEPKLEVSGFQTASGKNLTFKKENIIKDIEKKNLIWKSLGLRPQVERVFCSKKKIS